VEHAKFMEESGARQQAMKEAKNDKVRDRLKELGAEVDPSTSLEDLEKRLEEVRNASTAKMRDQKVKAEEYNQALLHELRTQSDLLAKIAEKLGA